MQLFENWFRTQPTIEGNPVPWVTLAYAQSLDGSLAAARGSPLRLSGPESLQMTHHLRARHDAILVGIGTVLSDDPRLTARGVFGDQPQPVVLDTNLRMPLDARLFAHPKKPWLAAGMHVPALRKAALQAKKAAVIHLDLDAEGRIPLAKLLAELGRRGIQRLMVEGGAKVISGFLEAGFVDGLIVTIAPVYIGGMPVLEKMLCQRLQTVDVEKMGQDIVLWGTLG